MFFNWIKRVRPENYFLVLWDNPTSLLGTVYPYIRVQAALVRPDKLELSFVRAVSVDFLDYYIKDTQLNYKKGSPAFLKITRQEYQDVLKLPSFFSGASGHVLESPHLTAAMLPVIARKEKEDAYRRQLAEERAEHIKKTEDQDDVRREKSTSS